VAEYATQKGSRTVNRFRIPALVVKGPPYERLDGFSAAFSIVRIVAGLTWLVVGRERVARGLRAEILEVTFVALQDVERTRMTHEGIFESSEAQLASI
jgi:hypothetical protein